MSSKQGKKEIRTNGSVLRLEHFLVILSLERFMPLELAVLPRTVYGYHTCRYGVDPTELLYQNRCTHRKKQRKTGAMLMFLN